jgi:hypothetical protein
VAKDSVGEKAVTGCYLTKVEAAAVILELRLSAPDAAGRDTLRSTLLSKLAQRFASAKIGSDGTETPAFS